MGYRLWLSTHFTDCLYHVSFLRYRPLDLPLSCEIVEKGSFWASDLQGKGTSTSVINGEYFLNQTRYRQPSKGIAMYEGSRI